MSFELLLLSALTAGFFGSLHCVGMCGGIASALGMSMVKQQGQSFASGRALFFQIGRLSSYSVAGYLAGTFGEVLTQSEAVKFIAIFLRLLSAVFIVGLGFYLAGLFNAFTKIEKIGVPLWKKISPLTRAFLPVKNIPQAFSLGFLWGWIPCGLSYSMLLWSLSNSNAVNGALLMFAFGLGTLPAMLSLTVGARNINSLTSNLLLRKIVGFLIVLGGSYTLVLTLGAIFSTGQHQH